jgi:hypothetical protein
MRPKINFAIQTKPPQRRVALISAEQGQTLRFSGGALTYLPWHFMHHLSLQPVVKRLAQRNIWTRVIDALGVAHVVVSPPAYRHRASRVQNLYLYAD